MQTSSQQLVDLLELPRYLPRITENDTRPVERALAGATLLDGMEVSGRRAGASLAR